MGDRLGIPDDVSICMYFINVSKYIFIRDNCISLLRNICGLEYNNINKIIHLDIKAHTTKDINTN